MVAGDRLRRPLGVPEARPPIDATVDSRVVPTRIVLMQQSTQTVLSTNHRIVCRGAALQSAQVASLGSDPPRGSVVRGGHMLHAWEGPAAVSPIDKHYDRELRDKIAPERRLSAAQLCVDVARGVLMRSGLRCRRGRPAVVQLRPVRAFSAAAPTATSWVPLDERGHFPLQNLPYGVVSAGTGSPRACVRIGDHVRTPVLRHRGTWADSLVCFQSRRRWISPCWPSTACSRGLTLRALPKAA